MKVDWTPCGPGFDSRRLHNDCNERDLRDDLKAAATAIDACDNSDALAGAHGSNSDAQACAGARADQVVAGSTGAPGRAGNGGTGNGLGMDATPSAGGLLGVGGSQGAAPPADGLQGQPASPAAVDLEHCTTHHLELALMVALEHGRVDLVERVAPILERRRARRNVS